MARYRVAGSRSVQEPGGGFVPTVVPPALADWLTETSARTTMSRAQLVRFILEMVQRDPRLLRRALAERSTIPGPDDEPDS
jgi:hypothetical protein